jgi:mannose-6-phosphate isomerase-like protein (cupin superfamily)
MSYPTSRFHDQHGVVSASFRPAEQAVELPMKASAAAYLATGNTTHGQFGLYRWDFAGPPSGPDPHFHRSISESFFILSGVVRLYNGDRWSEAGPGDFLYVPEGGVHAFRNESGEPASMLLLFAPGAPREEYFAGLAHLAQMTDQERADFYVRHDTYWC